jgi:hypothetical protein
MSLVLKIAPALVLSTLLMSPAAAAPVGPNTMGAVPDSLLIQVRDGGHGKGHGSGKGHHGKTTAITAEATTGTMAGVITVTAGIPITGIMAAAGFRAAPTMSRLPAGASTARDPGTGWRSAVWWSTGSGSARNDSRSVRTRQAPADAGAFFFATPVRARWRAGPPAGNRRA